MWPNDVLEMAFHSSGTFYSAESKLVLISKYIKTIDQVFRGNKNNNHQSMGSPMAISHISTSPCKFCIAKTNSTTNI
jgi:hypothetical protein